MPPINATLAARNAAARVVAPYEFNCFIAYLYKCAGKGESVKIRACYNSIPAQLAKENKKFQYKVVQRGGSAAVFGESIEWLNFAGIVLKCQRIEQASEPVSAYADLSSFKLYMGDTGLLVMKSGLSQHTALSGEPNIFMGAVCENYVAQTLIANGYNLYYWTSGHTAELDFVIQKDNDIIGVEVKKSYRVKSKSLFEFIKKYNPSYSIRLSEKNFGAAENNVIPISDETVVGHDDPACRRLTQRSRRAGVVAPYEFNRFIGYWYQDYPSLRRVLHLKNA